MFKCRSLSNLQGKFNSKSIFYNEIIPINLWRCGGAWFLPPGAELNISAPKLLWPKDHKGAFSSPCNAPCETSLLWLH